MVKLMPVWAFFRGGGMEAPPVQLWTFSSPCLLGLNYVYKLVFSFYFILATKMHYWLTLRLKSHPKANLLLLLVADPHVSISNWSVNWPICLLTLLFNFTFFLYFCHSIFLSFFLSSFFFLSLFFSNYLSIYVFQFRSYPLQYFFLFTDVSPNPKKESAHPFLDASQLFSNPPCLSVRPFVAPSHLA